MTNTKALVTIVIGDQYINSWKTFCYPSWKHYAERFGYDILAITSPIDTGPLSVSRPLHWQKLLVLRLADVAKYKHVVWLDADITINPETSPCVVTSSGEHAKNDRSVGVVRELTAFAQHTDPALAAAVNRRQRTLNQTLNQGLTWRDVYRLNGFSTTLDEGFNAGVMVLKPEHHAGLFTDIYETYSHTQFSWFENAPLAFHLVSNGLVHGIPDPFNTNVSLRLYEWYPFALANNAQVHPDLMAAIVRTIHENSYFLHFLGGGRSREALSYVPMDFPPAPAAQNKGPSSS